MEYIWVTSVMWFAYGYDTTSVFDTISVVCDRIMCIYYIVLSTTVRNKIWDVVL